MKKNLQSHLKLLANEILSNSDLGDVARMKNQAKELYEKLVILEYLESQISGKQTEHSLDSKSFREENWFKEPEPVPQPENKEVLAEPLMEKIKDLVAQMPEESQQVDELLEQVLPKKTYTKNDLEDFAVDYQETPVFERKEPQIIEEKSEPVSLNIDSTVNTHDRPKSLNEAIGNGLQIGLNDQMAFIKHLFDGSADEYNRVLSLIASMHSFDEANTFIKGKVKPDYNYWLKKEEVSERFMNIIEKSFN